MNKLTLSLITASLAFVYGCGETDPDAPPNILLGDSVCIECGMIVSDERFGTATIVEGDRGSQPLIFDDFNCQKIFEHKHPEVMIITRWSRDYETLSWFHTDEGWFVQSMQIRSPMASKVAGFETLERAEVFADSIEGEVITFDDYDIASES